MSTIRRNLTIVGLYGGGIVVGMAAEAKASIWVVLIGVLIAAATTVFVLPLSSKAKTQEDSK